MARHKCIALTFALWLLLCAAQDVTVTSAEKVKLQEASLQEVSPQEVSPQEVSPQEVSSQEAKPQTDNSQEKNPPVDVPVEMGASRRMEELKDREELEDLPKDIADSVDTPRIMQDNNRANGKLVTDEFPEDYMCKTQRYAPPPSTQAHGNRGYVISELRLRQIRTEFLYCFFDKGADGNEDGDYQKDIHNSVPQVHKNFNFQLPFYGFRFNYTRLSMHGHIEFSDPPEHYTYPLVFPNKDWPKKNDPSFIGMFFSKMRIGKVRDDDEDLRKAGVYFRLERDLHTRTDQYGVEMREKITWDIREGVVGADTFEPKHAITVTWKNMSFSGGIDNSLYTTNTFQLVLATDEVYTYAILNYAQLRWLSHTEAGGDTTGGEGGVPAFVGFNAGNGTQAYEYHPYSQSMTIRDLVGRGWANGFPGRHIFRIDEKIMLGTCNKDIAGANLPLVFAPESGNMLGGTVVNITGPCFLPNEKIRCRFDTEDVVGTVIDTNRAICIQPFVMAEGYVRFEIATGDSKYNWKGKFFIETPATATERITFFTKAVHEKSPAEIKISWNARNLTSNTAASVRISLWGYKETTTTPQLLYIDMIEESAVNTGNFTIIPGNFRNRNNYQLNELQFGFLMINLTNPAMYQGLMISPVLWSKPIPLAWYFLGQWEREYGARWSDKLCDAWTMHDRYLKNFAAEVPQCPCTLQNALMDKGRFLPDFDCDKDANPDCFYHKGAVHCVRTGAPSLEGSEQQCCYDKNGYLMLTYDQQWGSRPHRSHNLGYLPWNEANKVPTLSHWFHDMIPFYICCLWQEESAVGCETFRFERRPTQDCVAYQSPSVATVFGDPHIITFDDLEYTFNGKGEFVLLHANSEKTKLDVQGRFEQVPRNIYGEVRATHLTAVAARDNTSAIIEIRLRPQEAQWRYRLDVLADGKKVYFDRESLRIQHFAGVTVYAPTYILNQSEIIVMFESGAGVEVVENKGFMTTRVYLPWTFINQTRGLFGNWSFDMTDDFTKPDGMLATVNVNDFERIHKDFAIKWLLEDQENKEVGNSLFYREYGRTPSFYANKTFEPEWRRTPAEFIPPNRTHIIKQAEEYCGTSYQCRYDYAISLNRDMAHYTKNYQDSYTEIKTKNNERVISCGVLETPRFGRKSNFLFVPGTKVVFECSQGFVLIGDQRRQCMPDGRWDTPVSGYTECLREQEYSSRQAGVMTGIILVVILPILIALFAIWFCCTKRRKENDDNSTSWRFSPTPSKKGALLGLDDEFDSGIDSARPSKNSNNAGKKKRRSYDQSYRTGEPLPNRQAYMDDEKEWELDESERQAAPYISDSAPSDLSSQTKPKSLDDSVVLRPKQATVERGEQEYSSRQAGVTAGIILAVIIPILLAIVCVVYQGLKRRKRARMEENDNTRAYPIMTSRSPLHDDDNDDDKLNARGEEIESRKLVPEDMEVPRAVEYNPPPTMRARQSYTSEEDENETLKGKETEIN